MSKLINAEDARELTKIANLNKKVDELLEPIFQEIRNKARLGDASIIIDDDKEWYKASSEIYKIAISNLLLMGYKVTDNEHKHVRHGGRPNKYHGITISW